MKKKLFSEVPFIRSGRLTIKAVTQEDAELLQEMIDNPNVYRYEPTYLYEKQYEDVHYVIEHLYDECWEKSIILGIYEGETFCGLIEMYDYRGFDRLTPADKWIRGTHIHRVPFSEIRKRVWRDVGRIYELQ